MQITLFKYNENYDSVRANAIKVSYNFDLNNCSFKAFMISLLDTLKRKLLLYEVARRSPSTKNSIECMYCIIYLDVI